MIERTDEERVVKLIARIRLLIALADEIPTETKLNTQEILKMFEAAVGGAGDDEAAQRHAAGYFDMLYRDLQEHADIEALLCAVKVFVPYL